MSKIGRMPVAVPKDCKVDVSVHDIKVKGPKGELHFKIPGDITVKLEGANLMVSRANEEKPTKAKHGLTRAMIRNMIEGVTKGYEKRITLNWKGGKMDVVGGKFDMNVNFIKKNFAPPKGITIVKEKGDVIVISGIDRQLVGEVAAKIRSFLPADPYKAKGLKYDYEVIKLKPGKSAAK